MSQEKELSAIALVVQSHGKDVVLTVAAQVAVNDQWVKLGKLLFKGGVTTESLTKPTEKRPNKVFDEDAFRILRDYVVAGVSAKRKPEAFPYIPKSAAGAVQVSGKGHRWTVAEIVTTDAAYMREHDVSETFRAVRARLLALIDQLIGKVIAYVNREQNPDAARGVKGKGKTDDKKTEVVMPETWEAAMQFFTHCQNVACTMPATQGGKPLSAREIGIVHDALASIIATLRRHVK